MRFNRLAEKCARLGLSAVAVAAIGLAVAISPASAQKFTMKLAIAVANDPLHEYIKAYKKELDAKTGGRIKTELYPAGQLGNTPRSIEGLVLGTIEQFAAPAGFFKGVDLRYQVLEVPGVFQSPRHAHDTITDPEFRTPFLGLGVPKGIKGVSVWMYGPTSYATLKPVRRLDDFKGKKFRVLATKVETEVMRRLGATGVPMPYLDTIQALQRRAIDGIRSNIVVMNATKHWTVAKFITVVDDTYIPCVGFVAMSFFNKLPRDLQTAVEDAGRAVESHMYDVGQRFATRAEKAWHDSGAEVIRLSAADQTKFMGIVQPIGDDVLGKQTGTRQMFDLMKKVAASHRPG